MDDQIWFYIIAAVIYFLTRKKKKKAQPQQPQSSSESAPSPQQKPISFEELLKEITEGKTQEQSEHEVVVDQPEPVQVEEIKKEGRSRQFADDESRRIYEDSIKRAEEIDIPFEADEDYASKKLFKHADIEEEHTIADEIREGLQSTDSARKAIIYSEILNRKF